MQGTVGRIVLGFIAAVISVLIVHQTIVYLLISLGYLPGPNRAWSLTATVPPYGVPLLVNSVFWGGLWGILFAFVHQWLPGPWLWLKGLVFGLLIVLVSNWTLLPLIKAHVFGITRPPQVLFSGYDPMRMLAVILIVGGFGLGLGIIYGLIARDRTA